MIRFTAVCRYTILLIVFINFSAVTLRAEIIQIGSGSLYNLSLPVEPYADYSYSQSIYSSLEIVNAGVISQIGWQYRINGNIFPEYTNQFSIYMATTQRTGFASNTDWVPVDSLTLVFSGMLSPQWFSTALPGQGWLYIPLQTAFDYNGTGNLVIAVDENMPENSSSGDDFNCHETDTASSIECHSYTINPDVTNPPPAYPGNPLLVRPNLKLDIATIVYQPYSPSPAEQAIDVPVDATFSWQSAATSWDVWLAETGHPLVQVAAGLIQPYWTPAQELALYRNYQWRVTAHVDGEVFEGSTWHFTTVGETLTAPQNLSALGIGQTVRLNWSPPTQGSVMSYRVFRNDNLLDEVQAPEFTDTAVEADHSYYYYVKAVNHLNQISPPSNTATITITGNQVILYQPFETVPDFSSDIPGWQILDEDHSPTWEWENTSFPGEGDPLGWIVFNPAQATPPVNAVLPYAGSKMLLSISALNPPGNDWLISLPLQVQPGFELSFQARSYTADFALERLRLLVSTTDSLLTSFQPLSEEPWLSLPAAWTAYTYDLSDYAGQRIYLAWQSVSWDAFALCLDDILITQTVSNQDIAELPAPSFRLYPNPAHTHFSIIPPAKAPFDLSIYNSKGQKLYQKTSITGFEWQKSSGVNLPSGIYLIRLKQGTVAFSKRIVIF